MHDLLEPSVEQRKPLSAEEAKHDREASPEHLQDLHEQRGFDCGCVGGEFLGEAGERDENEESGQDVFHVIIPYGKNGVHEALVPLVVQTHPSGLVGDVEAFHTMFPLYQNASSDGVGVAIENPCWNIKYQRVYDSIRDDFASWCYFSQANPVC